MDKRYKDGRTLTAFRLSDEDRRRLDWLAAQKETTKADMVRSLIKAAYDRRAGK